MIRKILMPMRTVPMPRLILLYFVVVAASELGAEKDRKSTWQGKAESRL